VILEFKSSAKCAPISIVHPLAPEMPRQSESPLDGLVTWPGLSRMDFAHHRSCKLVAFDVLSCYLQKTAITLGPTSTTSTVNSHLSVTCPRCSTCQTDSGNDLRFRLVTASELSSRSLLRCHSFNTDLLLTSYCCWTGSPDLTLMSGGKVLPFKTEASIVTATSQRVGT